MAQTPTPETPQRTTDLRTDGNIIDQRQQQIDPAGKHREQPGEAGPHRSQKQPGQDLDDPQD